MPKVPVYNLTPRTIPGFDHPPRITVRKPGKFYGGLKIDLNKPEYDSAVSESSVSRPSQLETA